MSRALASLKYVPAVLCGLLVVAWVVSLPRVIWIGMPGIKFMLNSGAICASSDDRNRWSVSSYVSDVKPPTRFGWLSFWRRIDYGFWGYTHYFSFPIPLFLTLLLPFAGAPFSRFRFPLWSYFAWTALIAAELAYYLR